MSGFLYTRVAGARRYSATPDGVDKVIRSLQKRATWEGIIISPNEEPGPDGAGQFPVLNLSWYPGYGYQVQCFESAARLASDFLATGSVLSKPQVYVELDGQGQELWPPELFVSFESAAKATRHLLVHGSEDPSLLWIPANRFPRRSTRPRRQSAT